MTPANIGSAFLGFSKWAQMFSYETPAGTRWAWFGIGAMSHENAAGFLTKDAAWQDARGKGYEVEDETPVVLVKEVQS